MALRATTVPMTRFYLLLVRTLERLNVMPACPSCANTLRNRVVPMETAGPDRPGRFRQSTRSQATAGRCLLSPRQRRQNDNSPRSQDTNNGVALKMDE